MKRRAPLQKGTYSGELRQTFAVIHGNGVQQIYILDRGPVKRRQRRGVVEGWLLEPHTSRAVDTLHKWGRLVWELPKFVVAPGFV